jgi:integrase
MSKLRDAVEEYIAMRREFGFQFRNPAILLREFARFAEKQGADFITTALALHWAQLPVRSDPAYWACRLSVVRQFTVFWQVTDPRTEIPPLGLLPYRYRRKAPYIYTDTEIRSLIEAAQQLPSRTGLRPLTYSTLFGLLIVTGMRISESLALNDNDVALDEGLLTIRRTKFGKSRLVPVHSSTLRVLNAYVERRNQLLPSRWTNAFFVSEQGTPLTQWNVRYTFVRISREIGLRAPARSHGHGPRLHDLRHRFAVQALLRWYRDGLDVERQIPKLATYLGHVHVNDTYWYLSAVPELLELASQRLADGWEGLKP